MMGPLRVTFIGKNKLDRPAMGVEAPEPIDLERTVGWKPDPEFERSPDVELLWGKTDEAVEGSRLGFDRSGDMNARLKT